MMKLDVIIGCLPTCVDLLLNDQFNSNKDLFGKSQKNFSASCERGSFFYDFMVLRVFI